MAVVMAKTGRKPFESVEVVPYGYENRRLRPPEHLGQAEKRAFLDLVLSCPVSQFRSADVPLLCRWAELTVMAEVAMGEMTATGMVTADGKVSAWVTIHEKATKGLAVLALRLRLGPQSRARKAPKTTAGAVSYYDRLELEGGDDGGLAS
jgi:phage terminase small subunit